MLLSQAPDPSSISGSSGWVGAGLLGLVLAWLMWVHIPAKDRQIKEIIDGKDKQVKELLESKDTLAATLTERFDKVVLELAAANVVDNKLRREDFKEALNSVITHCKEGNERITDTMAKELAEHTTVIVDLRRVLEELREFYLLGNKPPDKFQRTKT